MNGSQGIRELISNRQQWWTSYFVGQQIVISGSTRSYKTGIIVPSGKFNY